MPIINKLSLDGVDYDISNSNIEIGARIGTTAINIPSNTSKENPFICPSAGFLSIMMQGNCKIRIGFSTENGIEGGKFNGYYLWISADGANTTYGEGNTIFVVEGMKIYVDYLYSGSYLNFIPIEFYIK